MIDNRSVNLIICKIMSQSKIAQANIAAKEGNWDLVIQYLQEIPLNSTKEQEKILKLGLQVLELGDFTQRWDIAKILTKLGRKIINPLIEILKDQDADLELRWFVARILAEFNHPDVVSALVLVLGQTNDEDLVTITASALANMGQTAIGVLTDLLINPETRLLAVRSLCEIRHSETITPLLAVVDDADVNIRILAIEALSSFHDQRIIPVLISALKDISSLVRKEAIIGLGMRSDLLAEIDLVNEIKPLLYDVNIDVCKQAAHSLSRLVTNVSARSLFELLQSPPSPISLKIEAIRSLAWMSNEMTLKYLEEILQLSQDNPQIIQEIVIMLGRIDQTKLKSLASKILINFVNDQGKKLDNVIKQNIALSLGMLGDSGAKECLNQLIEDEHKGVRLHAIAALKKII